MPDSFLARAERCELQLAQGPSLSLLEWPGDGPPALLHHANGFCAAQWAPVVEPLAGRFHCFAMDARGHGESPAPSLEGSFDWASLARDVEAVARRVLDRTGAGRLGLGLGHSFGGTLVLLAAARAPGLFERVLALDPVILPPGTGTAPPGRGGELAERARRRRAVWPDRAAARAWFAERELFASWTPRALDLYVEAGLRERPDGRVELACPGAVEAAVFAGSRAGADPWTELPGLETPARLVWASRGDFPRAGYERLVASMPGADIEDCEAGHLIPMECPERVVESVLRFAEETASPALREAAQPTGRAAS